MPILIKIILSGYLLFLMGCVDDLCSNKIIGEYPSPNKQYIATVFERDCGATTSYIQAINIRESNKEFNSEDYENWIFTGTGQPQINILWNDNNKMKIFFVGSVKTSTKREQWKNIQISYH